LSAVHPTITLYCSQWLLPATSAPIADGAVAVSSDRIVSVGTKTDLRNQFPQAMVRDYGTSAIIPGLINAHSHLELTAMRGFLEPVEHDFFAWLKKLTFARLQRMTADDLEVSATWGACEAVRAGVTCVADASDSAGTTLAALAEVGLSGIVFQESFGPDPRSANENFEALKARIQGHRERETAFIKVGVSPHAPYTVSGPQLELISRFAIDQKLPVMMHAAETEMEVSLIKTGEGAFADGLKSRGIDWHAPGVSPIQYLRAHDVLETKPLLAHCIHADEADIETIQQTGASIAHCPKSNAKLGHGVAPLKRFVERGIAVGLGSDSVASNNLCDLIEEARFAILTSRATASRGVARFLGAAEAMRMLTVGGAAALGLQEETGDLRAGLRADFAVIDLSGVHQQPSPDPLNTLIFSSSGRDVLLTMIAGKEVYREGKVITVDEERLGARMREVGSKLIR
jgi:cytosine/adenosine deaminase-related metal-dependent hydrolase